MEKLLNMEFDELLYSEISKEEKITKEYEELFNYFLNKLDYYDRQDIKSHKDLIKIYDTLRLVA